MSAPPPLPTNRSRKNLLLLCVASIALLPLAAVFGYYCYYRASTRKAIRQLEARAAAKGEPLTLTSLAANYPPLPDEENAAVPLLELWKKEDPAFWEAIERGERNPQRLQRDDYTAPALDLLLGRKKPRLKRSEPLPQASRTAAETYLRKRAAHMDAVRSALARPRCRFPIRVEDGYYALLPHLAYIKGEASGFRIAGLVSLDQGDADRTLRSFEGIAQCGQTLADDPFLISQLVRLACLSMVIQDTERLLSQQSLSVQQLDRLRGLVERLDLKGALRSALIAERACALSVFDPNSDMLARGVADADVESPEQNRNKVQTGMRLLMNTGLGEVDKRFMLEIMEEAIALATEDSPEALAKTEQLAARIVKGEGRFPPKFISSMVLPALSGTANRFATFEARRRAALTAIAIEQYRNSHNGQLPARLEDLVSANLSRVPADPHDGQPLRYKHEAKGYLLYSIGVNRQDDHGKERPERSPAKDYDEVFIVER